MKKQKGFTLFEMIGVIVIFASLAIVGVVGVHFLAKFW